VWLTEGRPAQEWLSISGSTFNLSNGIFCHKVAGELFPRAGAGPAGGAARDVMPFPFVSVEHASWHSLTPGLVRDPGLVAGVHSKILPVHMAQVEAAIAERLQGMGDGHHTGIRQVTVDHNAVRVRITPGGQ